MLRRIRPECCDHRVVAELLLVWAPRYRGTPGRREARRASKQGNNGCDDR